MFNFLKENNSIGILSLMCLAAKTFIWPKLGSLKSPSVNYNVI